jgi:hypothetical protein
MQGSLALHGRRHHFFDSSSFIAAFAIGLEPMAPQWLTRASARLAASSAWHSIRREIDPPDQFLTLLIPPAPSATWPLKPSSRNTSPSRHRTCPQTSRACGRGQHTSHRHHLVGETVPRTVSLSSSTCNIPMICSSVRIVRFIVRPFLGADSSRRRRKNPVAGQVRRGGAAQLRIAWSAQGLCPASGRGGLHHSPSQGDHRPQDRRRSASLYGQSRPSSARSQRVREAARHRQQPETW